MRLQYHLMDNSSGVGVLDKAAIVLSALEAGPSTLAQLVTASMEPSTTKKRMRRNQIMAQRERLLGRVCSVWTTEMLRWANAASQ